MLFTELARKENIRQANCDNAIVSADIVQAQKDDAAGQKTDILVGNDPLIRKNKAKLGQRAMQPLQYGHACHPIASQVQHDYLACIEGK